MCIQSFFSLAKAPRPACGRQAQRIRRGGQVRRYGYQKIRHGGLVRVKQKNPLVADLENHSINKVMARKEAKPQRIRRWGQVRRYGHLKISVSFPWLSAWKESRRIAAYGCDHNPTAIDTSPILYRSRNTAGLAPAGLWLPLQVHTPGFTGGHRSIDPVILRDRYLRICHPNPQENKKRETNFPYPSMVLTILTTLTLNALNQLTK